MQLTNRFISTSRSQACTVPFYQQGFGYQSETLMLNSKGKGFFFFLVRPPVQSGVADILGIRNGNAPAEPPI
jgi:hypothetical protein